jgi:polyferredoxin
VRTLAVRILVCVLLAGAAPAHRLFAQQPAAPPAAPAAEAGAAAAQPPATDDGGWNFEDEEEEQAPTIAQVVQPQVLDLVLFTGFLVLALVSFFRKSVRLKYVTLVAAVLYLGVFRSQLYSIVNIFSMLTGNLPIFQHNLFWYLFAGFTLVSTVLWGRVYCGRVCAFGALTQLMDRIVPAKLRVEVPLRIERRASYIKYVLLAAVLVYYFVTRDILIYRYVEPFWMFSRQGTVVMWAGLATLLVATVFVRNLYCRFLCPVGAFLGVISQVTTVFRIKRWAECKTCKICEKTCEWGAIQGPKIVKSECVRCDDCERLYMDQQKCVHWIVIRRKSDVLARQAAAAAASPGLSAPAR